ncbi:MAG: HAD-IA family hydrolase [bacterium]
MIKFVYFDIGGVMIDDFSNNDKWQKMKSSIGVRPEIDEEFDDLYSEYELEELCLSRDVDSLMPIFSDKFNIKFPKNFSMLKYFVDHFDKNNAIWLIVAEVHTKYGIGLLTNMYVGMFDEITKRGLLPPVNWDVVIDSTIVGLQKPDIKIFELAETRSGFKGKEILFVDNNQKNIDTASNFGWNVFLYDSASHVESSKELLAYLQSVV